MATIKLTQTALHLGMAIDAFQIGRIVEIKQRTINDHIRTCVKWAFDKELESLQQTL